MQTIKTAIVVVLLLGVCYGAYVALNAPDPTLPPGIGEWVESEMNLDIEQGAAVDIPQLSQSTPPASLDSLVPPSSPSSGLKNPTLANSSAQNSSPSNGLVNVTSPPRPGDFVPPTPSSGLPSLGNDALKLPDLELPVGREGQSVPLPGAFADASPPSTLQSLTNSESSFSGSTDLGGLPPMPSLPGIDLPAPGGEPFPSATEFVATNSAPGAAPSFPSDLPSAESLARTSESGANEGGANKAANSKTAQPYATVREQALKLANDGKLREALAMMSPYFNHIELTHQEHLDLIDMLDALAAEVIYSKRHLLEARFVVAPGDTLESIANKYRISPEVLASVNRMGDSRIVLAGTEMKVFNGPFRGEVDLSKGELTLYLGNLYAGRFPVSIGKEPAPVEGNYSIVGRRRDKSYVDGQSKYIAANDPRNPYGGYHMDLGNNLCIHGSPDSSAPDQSGEGCISLAPLDAKEVYSLLTQGSVVVVK